MSSLFRNLPNSLQLLSLILRNEHLTCLTQRYFTHISMDVIQSMFTNHGYARNHLGSYFVT